MANKIDYLEIQGYEISLDKKLKKDIKKYHWSINEHKDRVNHRIRGNVNGKTKTLQRFIKEKSISRELNNFERVYFQNNDRLDYTTNNLIIK